MDEEIETEGESQEMEESQNKKANTMPVIGVIIALIAVAGVIVAKNTNPKSAMNPTNVTPVSTTSSNSATPEVNSKEPNANIKEFTVDGSSFKFVPSTLTVNKGDTVKITFKDDDGMHNLVIDGYNISTKIIKTGESDPITFVADKAGTFDYYCSVGTHREKGMTGKLTVQ